MKDFDLSGSDDGLKLRRIGHALILNTFPSYYRCIISGDGIMRSVSARSFVYTNSIVRYRSRWTANEMGRNRGNILRTRTIYEREAYHGALKVLAL